MRLLQRPTDVGDLALAVRLIPAPVPTHRPPVLMVHGMGGDHRTWRSLAAVLRRGGRSVIAVDLRGHGRSGRASDYRLDGFTDDLRFVLNTLDVGRVDIIGHSLGAHAALRLAMSEPDLVGSLVLEELLPMPSGQADLDEKVVVGAGFAECLRGLGWFLVNPTPFLRYDRTMGPQIREAFTHADPLWWDQLGTVAARTLVISGGTHSFLPTHLLARVVDAMSRARLEVIEAGHSVHRDRRRRFRYVTTQFLEQS